MSELVVQLSEQISQFTELLKQISEADFDDGLNEAASGVLGKLLGNDKRQSLTALRFKVQDAKKKLKEVRPNKRKSTGTHGKKPKKPRLEEVSRMSGVGASLTDMARASLTMDLQVKSMYA
ncbi:hypothetical protein FRC12_013949 [Ceratobasidium sp. 428]|nr:hypothetical protein FRC12_013949 [Ceratobasidium sp. 428]